MTAPTALEALMVAREVNLNGWSAETEAFLATAYAPVIENLNTVTGLTFRVAHTGGNIWHLAASLSGGREVVVTDAEALHADFDGEADYGWTAAYYEDVEPVETATVETDLTCDGALYAVAVVLMFTAR